MIHNATHRLHRLEDSQPRPKNTEARVTKSRKWLDRFGKAIVQAGRVRGAWVKNETLLTHVDVSVSTSRS